MTHSAEILERAKSLLDKPKSVPFLTQAGSVAELRFSTPTAAAECRNDPDSAITRHKFVRMLTDIEETAAALLVEDEGENDVL
jgi:hypothetical protein